MSRSLNAIRGVDRAGEKALAERAERDHANAEFFERRQNFVFRLARPQRILALQRGDRLHGRARGG